MLHVFENKKTILEFSLLLLTWQLLAGCATVTGGTSQTIEITSDPEGATVVFSPSGQEIVTPSIIKLDRSTDHVATFSLDGYDETILRINRVQRGAVLGSALIPFYGAAALAIDALSDAEFNLYPDPIDVVLLPAGSPVPQQSEVAIDGKIVVFNRNTSGGVIYFSIDGAEPCKLEKWNMTKVNLDHGVHDLTVYHLDVFKFSDDYEMIMPEGVRFIGVFSGIASTNFSYYDELPDLKEGFTEISCHSDDSIQETLEDEERSESEPPR